VALGLRHALNDASRRVEAAEIIRSSSMRSSEAVAKGRRTTWSLIGPGHLAGDFLSLDRRARKLGGRQL